jgi:PadR family transcriptional regulator PadR
VFVALLFSVVASPLTHCAPRHILLSTVERRTVASETDDILQGTLDLLVLKALQLGAMHGWGISDRLQQGSRGVLQLNQGSLYPALYRLERQGFLTSSWRTTENNRRARYYALTVAGRRALLAEQEKWERQSEAVNLVLRMSAT